jgi:hypothetical protein
MQRCAWRGHPLLPPTGSSWTAIALAPPSAAACRTGSVILTASEPHRRMPRVSSIWIPGRRWAPAPDHPAGRNPAGCHARARRGEPAATAQAAGAPEDAAARSAYPYTGITLSNEGGQGERAHSRRSARRREPRYVPGKAHRMRRSVAHRDCPRSLAWPFGAAARAGPGVLSRRRGEPRMRRVRVFGSRHLHSR